jgi:alanyl-tRNA synthetase
MVWFHSPTPSIMSERLYFHDAYTTQFTAEIVERVQHNGRFALVLNHTYFYPTSGGQPADLGRLNGEAVIDVTIRPEDGAILHWVGELPTGPSLPEVTAKIDWPRRFDHMQQHTGQHILSQAFICVADAQTIGFHLGDERVTIDLDSGDLTTDQLIATEKLANQIVWENRPIHIRLVTLAEARQLSLRKLPPLENDKLRLIDIEEFDLTACGGTHVSQTGAVGLIKIIKLERIRQQVRIEFRCGQRALADYDLKNQTIQQLMAELTTGQTELVTAVTRLQSANKEARRMINKLKADLWQVEAEQLVSAGQKINSITIVAKVYQDTDGADLKVIGNNLTLNHHVVALLGVSGPKAQLLFCRSEDAPGDMNVLLQSALRQLGKGGGGGSALSAQGGGPPVEDGRLRQVIEDSKQALIAQFFSP